MIGVWGSMVVETAAAASDKVSIPVCGIAVMAKASLPGRSKTRLVPPLTCEEAAHCNTAFLRDAGDNILAAAAHASVAGYVAFGPSRGRSFSRTCPRRSG
jgi:hypothetical protein